MYFDRYAYLSCSVPYRDVLLLFTLAPTGNAPNHENITSKYWIYADPPIWKLFVYLSSLAPPSFKGNGAFGEGVCWIKEMKQEWKRLLLARSLPILLNWRSEDFLVCRLRVGVWSQTLPGSRTQECNFYTNDELLNPILEIGL